MKSALLACAALVCLAPAVGHASLVYDSTIQTSAQGFGNVPRALTIQDNSTESGCVGVNGTGGIVIGSSACISSASVHDSNGVTNTGGSEVPPLTDNQKYGIPTLSSLGITSADQIGLLFNATEPGGNGLNLTDLTLKFYSSTGSLVGAIDGQYNFSTSLTGNGSAGFVFTVSSDELAYVNGLLGGTTYLALEATATGTAGGPESFALFNLNTPPTDTPEPATLAVLTVGLAGLGFTRLRRAAV